MRQLAYFVVRFWVLALASIVMPLSAPSLGVADLVWTNGAAEPVSGKVVGQTTDEIRFQQFDSGSFGNPISIKKDNIELLVTNIDSTRLESLQPENPGAYRDYAEELSSQRKDAAAIALARRLYLIAAYHGQQPGKMSSILGLIELANSDSERNQFQMLKFLYDPGETTDSRLPRQRHSKDVSQRNRKQMLQIVRSLRQDNSEVAARILNTDEARSLVANWNEHVSYDELVRMTKGNRISKVELSKLIATEVDIVYSDALQKSVDARQKKWSDFAIQTSRQAAKIPSLENVTEMDPRECIYRNGKWVKP